MDLSTLKAAITEGAKTKQWSPMAAKDLKNNGSKFHNLGATTSKPQYYLNLDLGITNKHQLTPKTLELYVDVIERGQTVVGSTSHKRQFVHQPSSAADIFLKPPSTSLTDSYSQSGPFGSSVYRKDFSWKPACKPECIRTGTASGQRRNNPHPSKSFMMWRLPRDAARSSEYISFPLKRLPSEGEIREALTTQYRSTYKCDFMGTPPEYNDTEKAAGRLAPLHDRQRVSLSTDTEMRASYRRPNQKPELLANPSHYSCKTDPNVACRGIVPAVVSRNLHVHQKGANVTTYGQFFGKRVNNMTSVIKSLMPQELQQLHRILPKKEQEALKAVLRENVCPNNEEKVDKLPEAVRDSGLPEWSSSWPGPR